jgi:type I restriction-modification system DNA methylase subunit
MTDVVQKLWGFCHTLRHDGIDYGDYIEQITYLLFLKMADEKAVEVPPGCAWPDLRAQSGTELTDYYIETLRKLGRTQGTAAHFKEFEKCYGADPNGLAKRSLSDSKEDRFRVFDIAEIKERGFKLDGFKWLKEESLDDADDLPEPEELITDAVEELTAAVGELNAVLALLENGNGRDGGTR